MTEIILPDHPAPFVVVAQTPQPVSVVESAGRGPAGPTGPAGPVGGYPLAATYTYVDGRITTTLEDGVLTTYAYNPDGTIHSDTRAGVTRIYSYDTVGNLTGIAAA